MTLVIDVETVPLIASLAAPYPEAERPYPANYKNADAIERWRETDRAAWAEQRVKECSLNPRLGRIAVLGYALDEHEAQTCVAESEEAEAIALRVAWDLVASYTGHLVTFNGTTFDLRFFAIRSMILNVLPQWDLGVSKWFQRYRTSPHFDVRSVLTQWDDRQSGKLTDWCASFGIKTSDATNGADVYALSQAGDWDTIAEHCRSDVNLTRELYRRVSPLFN